MMKRLLMIGILILFLVGCGSDSPDVEEIVLVEDEKGNIEIAEQVEIKPIIEQPKRIVSFDYLEGECEDSIDANNVSEIGIKAIDWSGDTATITAYISMNCDESIKKADYDLLGNEFYLTYTIDHCEDCSECRCAKKVTFVVDGIRQKKYDYKLVGL